MYRYESKLICLGLIILGIFFLLKYFNYNNAIIDAFDNLDGRFVYWSLLSQDTFEYFNPSFIVEQIGDGIIIGNIFPSINIGELIYKILPVYYGYILNEIITRIIAFVGFFLLILNHFKLKYNNNYLVLFLSLTFAFLPFNPSPFLTVAAQPLLLNSILNFYKKKHKKIDWFICLVFPFFSNLVLGGFAVLIGISMIFLYQLIKKNIFNYSLLKIFLLMCIFYFASIYKGLYLIFFETDFQSIRSEFYFESQLWADRLFSSFSNSFGLFLFGHEHSPSMHTYFVLITLITALFLKKKNFYTQQNILIKLVSLNLLISILYGIMAYGGIQYLIFRNFEVLKMIKFERIHWLQPLIWYLIFYFSIFKIYSSEIFRDKQIILHKLNYFIFFVLLMLILIKILYVPILVENYNLQYPYILKKIIFSINFLIFILSIVFLSFFSLRKKKFLKTKISFKYILVYFLIFTQAVYNLNILKLNKVLSFDYRYSWHHNGIDTTTFDEYFSKDLFSEIKNYIPEDISEFKVGSVGLSPSIPLFNGFNVVDFYLSSYDLKYKKKFRKVIETELEKNKVIKKYYDSSGKRNYIYSADLGKNLIKFKKNIPNEIILNLNYNALKNLGCRYIFSITSIKDNDKNLEFIRKFQNIKHPHLSDIYLYRLI